MADLVNELVALSRLDKEQPPFQFSVFDVSAAVSESAESFREFAVERGHMLELEVVPGLSLNGDEYAIRQLVSILLDNAVKYTDEGRPMRLSLKAAKRGIVLETCNACSGIHTADPAELDRLFDRFYRADKARTKQTGGGFGIGLSITRSIVTIRRGMIQAELPEKGLIQFTVTLRGR
jgi:two-component system sensor histidine kinase CiaH